MKVFLTQSADECLWAIWDHDRNYSATLADAFQRAIDRFIRDSIGIHPEIDHAWQASRAIRRLIFRGRHNIFYDLPRAGVVFEKLEPGQVQGKDRARLGSSANTFGPWNKAAWARHKDQYQDQQFNGIPIGKDRVGQGCAQSELKET